jgi:hypothetical protein
MLVVVQCVGGLHMYSLHRTWLSAIMP